MADEHNDTAAGLSYKGLNLPAWIIGLLISLVIGLLSATWYGGMAYSDLKSETKYQCERLKVIQRAIDDHEDRLREIERGD